jgi:hypothetical protein
MPPIPLSVTAWLLANIKYLCNHGDCRSNTRGSRSPTPEEERKHNGENKKNLYDLVLTLFLI